MTNSFRNIFLCVLLFCCIVDVNGCLVPLAYHIDDIAPVLFHGRTNAQVEKLYDKLDGLAVLFAHTLVDGMMLAAHGCAIASPLIGLALLFVGLALLLVEFPDDDGQFGLQVVQDGGEYHGRDQTPLDFLVVHLGHGEKVVAE